MFPKFILFTRTDSVAELTDVVVETKKDKEGRITKLPPKGVYTYVKSTYHVDDKVQQGLKPSTLQLQMTQIGDMLYKQTITQSEDYIPKINGKNPVSKKTVKQKS